MVKRVKLEPERKGKDKEVKPLEEGLVLVENPTLSRAENMMAETSSPLQKHNALSLTLLGVAEVQAKRVTRTSMLLEAVENRLFSPDILEDLGPRDVLSLARTMRDDINTSARVVHEVVRTIDPQELESNLLAQQAKDITPPSEEEEKVSRETEVITGELLRDLTELPD